MVGAVSPHWTHKVVHHYLLTVYGCSVNISMATLNTWKLFHLNCFYNWKSASLKWTYCVLNQMHGQTKSCCLPLTVPLFMITCNGVFSSGQPFANSVHKAVTPLQDSSVLTNLWNNHDRYHIPSWSYSTEVCPSRHLAVDDIVTCIGD
jgi:hypothetical protein